MSADTKQAISRTDRERRDRVRSAGPAEAEPRAEPAPALDEKTSREVFACFPGGVISVCAEFVPYLAQAQGTAPAGAERAGH